MSRSSLNCPKCGSSNLVRDKEACLSGIVGDNYFVHRCNHCGYAFAEWMLGNQTMNKQASYVSFQLVEHKPKTEVYNVLTSSTKDILGQVKWWAQWRQYCFFPTEECVFSSGCLSDIIDFVKAQNDGHVKKVGNSGVLGNSEPVEMSLPPPRFCTGEIWCSCHNQSYASVEEYNAAHPQQENPSAI